MSAVIDFVEDVVGGVVEAVGDVVEGVVDVVKDVGRAIDDYVIEPIKEDPLTFIATAAGAYFLGPMAASTFGVKATVGAGIAAGAGNLAAGLVQGEDFDEALKGAVVAGATTFAGAELFGGTPSSGTDPLDDFLAANNNFVDDLATATPPPAFTTPAVEPAIAPSAFADDFAAQAPAFADDFGASAATPASTFADDALTANTSAAAPSATPSATPSAASVATPEVASPLQSLNASAPAVDMPTFNAAAIDSGFTPDYNLTSGMKPDLGFQVPKFTPADSLDIYGNPNYSMVPPGTTGGPGMQLPSAPNLGRMGGGQGLTVDIEGLPEFRYADGTPDTWTSGGKTYGLETPDVTVSSTGIRPTPDAITYDATTNMGKPSFFDQVSSGNFTDAAKNVGGQAIDWVKANPWTAAGVGLTALQGLGGAGGPPSAAPPPRGSTQDANFNKSLDLYEFMRDRANYAGDLNRYGQTGGEHQFFQNTRFVPIPIPGQTPVPAKVGGLIQMKQFAQGGMARGMQDPRQAQLAAAMAQQHPAGQGGPMGMAQGRAPMMPGRAQPQPGQRMPMQQGRQQMPQRPRDPKMAYYQYGNPPVQAKAMGGLSQVQSMKIGGGADGRSDDVNAVLSDGEYVFDAETVAMLGNGSSNAGAKKLDDMRKQVRSHKGRALASGKISPDAKSPLAYLKGA